jgi:hypothetical protein
MDVQAALARRLPNPSNLRRADGLLNAAPVVQCRNEERWIEAVLRPLWRVLGTALVGDTGSNDGTLPILRRLRDEGHIRLYELGEVSMREVGQVRPRLAQVAGEMGAEFIFLCDGDELYNEQALRFVAEEGMPVGKALGFTSGANVEERDGRMFQLAGQAGLTGRTAVIRVNDVWSGEYPFEGPSDFNRPELFHYFGAPEGMRYSHLHLHRCARSSRDADVPYRVQKQYQFAMQDRGPVGLGEEIDMGLWIADCRL